MTVLLIYVLCALSILYVFANRTGPNVYKGPDLHCEIALACEQSKNKLLLVLFNQAVLSCLYCASLAAYSNTLRVRGI